MSVDDFIQKVIGVPWVNRSCNFNEMDCWGLVILYYQYVLGISLKDIDGYKSKTSCIELEAIPEAKRHWIKINAPVNHCVFIAYQNQQPGHVGVVIDSYVLHAKGNETHGGQVQYNRLDAITRCYQKVEFYEYANLS